MKNFTPVYTQRINTPVSKNTKNLDTTQNNDQYFCGFFYYTDKMTFCPVEFIANSDDIILSWKISLVCAQYQHEIH